MNRTLLFLLLLALGKPAEKVVLESVKPGGDTKFWRDAAGVHHVPKRSLEEYFLAITEGASDVGTPLPRRK